MSEMVLAWCYFCEWKQNIERKLLWTDFSKCPVCDNYTDGIDFTKGKQKG